MGDSAIYAAYVVFNAKDSMTGVEFESFKQKFLFLLETNKPEQARELIEKINEETK